MFPSLQGVIEQYPEARIVGTNYAQHKLKAGNRKFSFVYKYYFEL